MTAPVPHGYPDWGRSVAQSDVVIVNDTAQSINAVKDYGIFFVGNLRALGVIFVSNGNAGNVSLTFYADQAGTIPIVSYGISLQSADYSPQPVRVMGAFVRVQVGPGPAVPFLYDLLVASQPDYGARSPDHTLAAGISVVGGPIGAGATVIVNCPVVLAGPAVWTANVGGGAFSAYLQTIDEIGGITFLDHITAASPVFDNRHAYLPSMHVRIRLDNNTGAPQTYDAFLTRLHP